MPLEERAPNEPNHIYQESHLACNNFDQQTVIRRRQTSQINPHIGQTYKTVPKTTYDQLYDTHNLLKEEYDALKQEQQTAKKKLQSKERQLKTREANVIQKEAELAEIYQQNRLLKDCCNKLELQLNDMDEQNKLLKLKLLASEDLRNDGRSSTQMKVNAHDDERTTSSNQQIPSHTNEVIMTVLSNLMTISTNLLPPNPK